MFCRNCGNQVKDDALFCDKCGSSVAGENKSGSVTIRSNKNVKIGIAIAAVITAVVIALIFIAVNIQANAHELNGKWVCTQGDYGDYDYYRTTAEFDRNGTVRLEGSDGQVAQGNWVYLGEGDDYLIIFSVDDAEDDYIFKVKKRDSKLIIGQFSYSIINETEFKRLD